MTRTRPTAAPSQTEGGAALDPDADSRSYAASTPAQDPSATRRALQDARDRALVTQIRDGNEQAFRELVSQYQDRIYALCLRMLRSPQEAEDVAQEVFLTVHRAVAGWRGESRFYTWMYRVATNHCKNRLKYLAARNYHRAEPLESAAFDAQQSHGVRGSHALQSSPPSPEQAVEGRRLEVIVERELRNLDPEHRLLIVLRDLQGLSYQDIVEITQLAEGTVKSRLHRARLALKKRIAPYLR